MTRRADRPLIRPVGRTLTSKPGEEPVSTSELKDQLRLDADDENFYLDTLISVARRAVEKRAWRALITQEWDVTYPEPWRDDAMLEVPLPPLQSVEEITYVDTDGATQTLAASDYQVDASTEPAVVAPARNEEWPSMEEESLTPLTVSIKAGYGDNAVDVPENFRQAILLTAATLFENRENVVTGTIVTQVPGTAEALIDMDHARALVR